AQPAGGFRRERAADGGKSAGGPRAPGGAGHAAGAQYSARSGRAGRHALHGGGEASRVAASPERNRTDRPVAVQDAAHRGARRHLHRRTVRATKSACGWWWWSYCFTFIPKPKLFCRNRAVVAGARRASAIVLDVGRRGAARRGGRERGREAAAGA
ncbi:unnamed protein product, partial [Amoebophrya sp. A120]